jgi:hypothetical protein
VRVDNFLSQRVLYLHGDWVSRRAVLKYVANIASGVHSGNATEADDLLIESIRRNVTFVLANKNFTIRFRSTFFGNLTDNFIYDRNEIDPTLLEVYTIAYMLTISSSIAELENIISMELNIYSNSKCA